MFASLRALLRLAFFVTTVTSVAVASRPADEPDQIELALFRFIFPHSSSNESNAESEEEDFVAADRPRRVVVYPTIQINPSTPINSVILAGLNPCSAGKYSVKADGNTYCVDTSGSLRAVYEVDCKFPFQYKGIWYDTCIRTDAPTFWCSIDSVFVNRFAFCTQECPVLASSLMVGQDASQTHTSCSSRNAQAVSLFPSQADIVKILSAHNTQRAAAPTATDLAALVWDFGLARLAQRRADTCLFAHDCYSCRKLVNNRTITVGQNAYSSYGYSQLIWNDVITAWSGEKASFVFGGPQTAMVGHYTQIVSNLAVKVGCGASQCGSNMYAYCNYATGQMDINRPYKPGTSCSACPSNCQNKLCMCSKLCQNGGTLDLNACKCTCPAYATGSECETLVCSASDTNYGCWAPDASYCKYSNIPPICPRMCKICTIS